jgi:hypothetical protein
LPSAYSFGNFKTGIIFSAVLINFGWSCQHANGLTEVKHIILFLNYFYISVKLSLGTNLTPVEVGVRNLQKPPRCTFKVISWIGCDFPGMKTETVMKDESR